MNKRDFAVLVTRVSRVQLDWRLAGADIVLVSLAWFGALALRFDVKVLDVASPSWVTTLPIWVASVAEHSPSVGLVAAGRRYGRRR